jgi:hypothetical protein
MLRNVLANMIILPDLYDRTLPTPITINIFTMIIIIDNHAHVLTQPGMRMAWESYF